MTSLSKAARKTAQPVSVIIPTFNGQFLLQKHLPVLEQHLRSDDTLIIVDDASTDETIAWLTKRYSLSATHSSKVLKETIPKGYGVSHDLTTDTYLTGSYNSIKVIVLGLSKNARFAEAVNTAVLLVSTEWFLLINNDVEITKTTLPELLKCTGENVFGIGSLEYQDSFNGEKSGKNKLWFEQGLYQHSKADSFDSGSTAWVSGGSGLFSTQKWKALGGFDLHYYPAYWEDVDISFSAKKRGWDVLFSAESIVLHQHETTNKKAFGEETVAQMSLAHGRYFTWKHATFLQRISYLIWQPYWMLKQRRQ